MSQGCDCEEWSLTEGSCKYCEGHRDGLSEGATEATRAERDRIAWLAEGMANKLHTMDADMVAGCLADLVAYLRSDR